MSFTYSNIIKWLEQNSRSCFYKKHFGFECFGCGIQRSFIALLKGNITESIKLYPPLIPIIITFTTLLLHLVFKFNNGAAIIKYLFIFTSSVIVINFLYKLIFLTL